MHAIAILLTVVALGAGPETDSAPVEYGWKPGEKDGLMELYVQIDPRVAAQLSKGEDDLLADVPEGLSFARIRIRVGTGPLPHEGWDPKSAAMKKPDLNGTPASTASSVRQPPNIRGATQTPNPRTAATTPGSQGSLLNPPQPGEIPNNTFENSRFNTLNNSPTIGRNGAQPSNTGTGQYSGIRPSSNPNLTEVKPPFRQPANDGTFPAGRNDNGWPANQANDPRTAGEPTGYGARTNLRDLQPGQGFDNQNSPWMNGPTSRDDAQNNPGYLAQQGNNPRGDFGQYQNPQVDAYGRPYYPNNYNSNPPPRNFSPPYRDGYNPNSVASTQPPPNTSLPLNPPVTNPPAASIAATTPAPGAAVTPTTGAAKPDARSRLDEAAAEKPWLPLTFTAMLLFASVGLNFYLGWIANGIYVRYRALLMEVRNVRAIAA